MGGLKRKKSEFSPFYQEWKQKKEEVENEGGREDKALRRWLRGAHKRREWERRCGGGAVMSHHDTVSPCGVGCCGGGGMTHAVTHTQSPRVPGHHAASMSPPAVEAVGRQRRHRGATGMQSSQSSTCTPPHTHTVMITGRGASLSLRMDEQRNTVSEAAGGSRDESIFCMVSLCVSHMHFISFLIMQMLPTGTGTEMQNWHDMLGSS